MSRDFITTWTGKRFNPLKPDATKVDIRDIAHALSQLCRFGGHCTKFYSVAEHSILVSRMVPPEEELAALEEAPVEGEMPEVIGEEKTEGEGEAGVDGEKDSAAEESSKKE